MANPRVAVVQFRPQKAAYDRNLDRMGSVFSQLVALDQPPDIVVFPETATSGYFLEGGIRDVAVPAGRLLDDLQARYVDGGTRPLDVVIGFYEEFDNHHHNSAMYATLGADPAIHHVHRKIFLPTYGVFDERRFVQPGHRIDAFDTRWGRAGIVICEDAWHSFAPTLAALDGARFVFVPTASPARGLVPARMYGGGEEALPASLERWQRLARNIASEHGVYVIMAQLIGFEGGKGFPGASVIVGPNGDPLAQGPLFEEALLFATLDQDEITRVRTDQPLLSDLRAEMPHLIQSYLSDDRPLPLPRTNGGSPAGRSGVASPRDVSAGLPVVAAVPHTDPLAIDPELVATWLRAFLVEEMKVRRGFAKGVVGLSGGVDSSLTAFLAAQALGPENVIGVRMPYATSSQESLDHAALVTEALGIETVTVDISAAVDGYAGATSSPPDATRLGNVMARMRMITLFDLAAAHAALPVGTGNKTERLLGYFTWHADDSPPVNPIGDLFKSQVWELARHVGVPDAIVTKPATADLIRGQTDENDLGISYPKADRILSLLLQGYEPDDVIAAGFTADEVAVVRRRLESTHWKRRLPTVAMVSQTAIGEYYLRPVDY